MNILKYPDKVILLAVPLLIAVGLIFIFSVSGPFSQYKNLNSWYFFVRQLIWAIIAMAVLVFCSRLDYRKFIKLSPAFLAISFVFLVLVLFTHARLNVHRWINLGFISFQPSEVFKISLLMYLAYVLVDSKGRPKDIKRMVPHMIISALGILLIAKQPDLGTLMLIFAAMTTVLFLAGLKLRYILVSCLAVILLGSVMVFGLGYEKDRIADYLNCLKDPLGNAEQAGLSRGYYQSRQSLISIGSGGFVGRGLGGGGQKNLFLPAPHTDFIFSASAEEGGLLLCTFIMGLLFSFGFATLKIAKEAADLRGALLAAGLGIMIVLQAIINIGVTLGLFPITGITLPFFSYGGSSLVISCAATGLILSVARYGDTPKIKYVRMR